MVRNSLIQKAAREFVLPQISVSNNRLRSQQFALHVAMSGDDQIRSHLGTRRNFATSRTSFFTKSGQRAPSSDFFQSGPIGLAMTKE